MGILSLLMAILIIPATQVAAAVPTIDTSKKGSITIYKYEYNGSGGVTGTGTTADASNVPTDAKELKGAGFTLYKVADATDLETYYAKEGTALPTVASFFTVAYDENDSSTWTADNVDTNKVKATIAEQETGDDGTTSFTGLDLGIYLVLETKTPAAVTQPAEPFLVSIPMTKTDGTDWLYDVHVYPKNKTTYGNVSIKKTGEGTAVLKGVKFTLQKEQTDGSWLNITNASGAGGDNTGSAYTLETNDSGIISVSGLSQGTYRFIETDLGANTEYIMDGATIYEFVVGADAKITYKNLNQTTDLEITIPNNKPTLEKTVKQNASSTIYGEKGDYSVGDVIDFKVTIDIPENIGSLKTFQIVDAPTNMTDNVGSIAMKVGGSAIDATAYNTPTQTGDGFTIEFVPLAMGTNNYGGKQLVLTYQATLNTAPTDMKVGNVNTATLTYSNNIIPTDAADTANPNNGKTETTDDITDDATVYSFAIEINKTGQDGATTKPLENVTFEMYKKVADTTSGVLTETEYKAAGLSGPGAGNAWLKVNGTTLETNSNGKATQTGLANGIYYLVETATNEGYNLLSKPVEVEVTVDYSTSVTDATATVDVNIKNSTGFTLPTTGGAGTLMFTLIGCVLVGGGAIILFRLKKKPQNA